MKEILLVLMKDLVHQILIDINQSKGKTKFCLSLHYNSDNIYLFVNGKEIFKFKGGNKNVNFPSEFCLGIISNKLDYADLE